MPIFINSPMAIDATEIYRESLLANTNSPNVIIQRCADGEVCFTPGRVETALPAEDADDRHFASGMANQWSRLHHLVQMAPDERNTILFTGFSPAEHAAQRWSVALMWSKIF